MGGVRFGQPPGSDQRQITMILERDAGGKPLHTFPHPALVAMMVMAMMPMVTMPVVAMPMVMVMTMRPPVLMVVMVARPPVVIVVIPPLHVGRQLAGVALRGCGNARTDRRRRLRLLHRNREGQKRTEDDKS
jgi:hypothetical protein